MQQDNDNLSEIKERLWSEQLVEDLLVELDCQNIKYVENRWEAQLPEDFNSDRKNNIYVYDDEQLNSSIWTRGIRGDIYSIVGYILYKTKTFTEVRDHLYQIVCYIANLFDWQEYVSNRDTTFEEIEQHTDPLAFLRPIQKQRKQLARKDSLLEKKNRILPDNTMNWYFEGAQWEFYKDGILPNTQKEFEVMYDRESERVVFPIHNKDGELIGVKGRYIGKDEQTLKGKKYMFLHRMDKSIELYNLHRALPFINGKSEVIVFESEKSAMLAWQWGYKNTVSLMGNELSPVQAMLLKQLESDIIFAFDKDIEWEHIQKVAKQIKSRICKAIYDDNDLLDSKDSPVDQGKETWDILYLNSQKSVR